MHMKNIKDVNVIDGFLLKESYSLYGDANFDYHDEIKMGLRNLRVNVRSYIGKENDVDNFKINFINGFADFLYETKYMLDQSRLSGVPINIILEDGRPDLENDDFSLVNEPNGQVSGRAFIKGKNDHNILGFNKSIDIESIDIFVSMHSVNQLVHEFGHILDFAYGEGKNVDLSMNHDFDNIVNEYRRAVSANKLKYMLSKNDVQYFGRRDEIYARMFHSWEYNTVEKHRSDNILISRKRDGVMNVEDLIADKVYDVNKDQVDTYYDSKFGSILEDFRLSELSIDDTKSVLTDVELLSKLTEIETDIFGNNNVSKLNNVKSIDIDL